MNRHIDLPARFAVLICTVSFLLAASKVGLGQDYDDRASSRPSTAVFDPDVPASEPRAGSIHRNTEIPDYQKPVFQSQEKRSASQQRASSTTTPARAVARSQQPGSKTSRPNGEYFNPRADDSRVGRRRTTVNRAAYQQMSTADGVPVQATPAMPLDSPEDLPMPGAGGSIAPMGAMPDGSMEYGGEIGMGAMSGDCGCDGGACGSGGCNNGCDTCDSCPDWYPGKDLTLSAGVHGFKNAVDAGQNGNFGFQEGVNWSTPFWNAAGIGFQIGFQAMQSDLHSSAFFTNDRSQYFFTTGIFRRQICERGWQWGVVYDHLSDQFDEDFDVSQVRGELSYLFCGHELGLWFSSNVGDDQPGADSTSGVVSFETVDLWAFFYRRRLISGGEGRLWVGATGESDLIFGGDLRVPVACDWGIVAAFNYVAPQNDTTESGQFPEAWNIGINLVWYVCPEGAFKAGGSRYRPLFNVADNGTLIANALR